MNPLVLRDAREKIAAMKSACQSALGGVPFTVPTLPGRDVPVVSIVDLRGKRPGLSTQAGQARLLNDLASIELQAMELAFRSLIEFPNAPLDFRAELAALALSEASHLEMCLNGLDRLQMSWGTAPVHISLWNAASTEDSVLDRLVIVHRYMEGGGLDAGVSILKKLNGVALSHVTTIVKTIVDEEVGHVSFGSSWFRYFCELENLNPDDDFQKRLSRLIHRIPRRLEKLDWAIRRRAGFNESELQFLEDLQTESDQGRH